MLSVSMVTEYDSQIQSQITDSRSIECLLSWVSEFTMKLVFSNWFLTGFSLLINIFQTFFKNKKCMSFNRCRNELISFSCTVRHREIMSSLSFCSRNEMIDDVVGELRADRWYFSFAILSEIMQKIYSLRY